MPKLTETAIRKAVAKGVEPGKKHSMLWDEAPVGLGLKLRPTGSHSWIFVYRPKGVGRAGASRTVTLGPLASIDLATARAAASKIVAKIIDGADPAQDVRLEKTREKRIMSSVIDEYEQAMKRRRLVNATQVASALKRGLSGLMAREVDGLTRADVVDQIEKLEVDKPGAASYLRTNARTLLEWCVSRGYAPYNVMAGLKRPKATRAERLTDGARTGRALKDGEIVKVWTACEAFSTFGGLVRAGLLTAMRRNELSGLKWADVKSDRIVIEAARAKTGVQHEVPITTALRALLNAQPRTKSPLVFGSMKKVGAEMSGWSKMLPRLTKAAGVDFTLHDLRRTTRTLMSRLGVSEDAAELAIGHARADLIARYNRDEAWEARVDAFSKVSDHISGLLGGGGAQQLDKTIFKKRPATLP